SGSGHWWSYSSSWDVLQEKFQNEYLSVNDLQPLVRSMFSSRMSGARSVLVCLSCFFSDSRDPRRCLGLAAHGQDLVRRNDFRRTQQRSGTSESGQRVGARLNHFGQRNQVECRPSKTDDSSCQRTTRVGGEG